MRKKMHNYLPQCRTEIRRGAIASLPVLFGLIPFGLLLGTQAVQKGLSVEALALMTGLNFGGGSEFAAIALWSSTPQMLTIVLVSILVNSRHLVMGASLTPYIRHLPRRKALPALFLMCDESWAISIADARRRQVSGEAEYLSLAFYLGLASSMWIIWVGSTVAGALIGPLLGDITRFGFDMAFPAVFFVLLKGMWKGVYAALPWLVSLISAGVTWHFVPGAAYVPVGAFSGIVTILFLHRKPV
ncbi:AzlC family ABC transporter permease [Citrobacter sp. JGM124]|nr:AzlC family ABC transporter permease [Citrobacter sp. JGM124]